MFSPMEVANHGDNFGGLFDSIKSGLQSVISSHTIVGRALAGDIGGATAGIIKATTSSGTPKAVSVPGPGGGLDPDGAATADDNTMLYVGLGGAALLGLFLLTRGR